MTLPSQLPGWYKVLLSIPSQKLICTGIHCHMLFHFPCRQDLDMTDSCHYTHSELYGHCRFCRLRMMGRTRLDRDWGLWMASKMIVTTQWDKDSKVKLQNGYTNVLKLNPNLRLWQRVVFASCSTHVFDANPHGYEANFLHRDQRAQGETTAE